MSTLTRQTSSSVTTLFTQDPIDDALQVLEEKLNEDQTLEERNSIPVAQVIHLTELCLRSTYCQFENQFYEQTDGAAMGLPLSPIVANLFMEHIEKAIPLPHSNLTCGHAMLMTHS